MVAAVVVNGVPVGNMSCALKLLVGLGCGVGHIQPLHLGSDRD